MNSELSSVMQRRSELLDVIARQREQIARGGARIQAPLKWVDRGIAVGRFLRANPLLVAGVVALLVVRRRSLGGILSAAWRVWKAYRYSTVITSRLLW